MKRNNGLKWVKRERKFKLKIHWLKIQNNESKEVKMLYGEKNQLTLEYNLHTDLFFFLVKLN